jgi:hypothetical protein
VSVALSQSLLLLLGSLCGLLLLAAAALLLGFLRGQAVPPQLAGLQAAVVGSKGSMESMAVLSTPHPHCHDTHGDLNMTMLRVVQAHVLLKLTASNSASSPHCTLPYAELTPPNLALLQWIDKQSQPKHGIP